MDEKETNEILAIIEGYPLNQEVAEAVAELRNRVVVENDDDDIQTNGQNTLRNGIRPYKAPRV